VGQGDSVDWVARDPDFAWVMWEIHAQSVQAATERLGVHAAGAALVLRLRCHQERPQGPPITRVLDIPLSSWCGHRLVPLGIPGAEHLCSVGVRAMDDPGGFFVPLVHSEPLRAPRHTPGDAPLRWEVIS
jgi:hypothetical protein